MIRITKASSESSGVVENAHHYTLGGQRIVFQNRVSTLEAFSEGAASATYNEMLHKLPQIKPLTYKIAKLRYAGDAPLGGELRRVECWVDGPLMQIDIAGQPCCMINLEQQHAHLLSEASFDERINLEVITGPAMMLMLAFKEVYCLHAGCIRTQHGSVALIAESGTGKSTLSEHVDQYWCQLADDVLPLAMVGNRESSKYEFGLFSYPQLKLTDAKPIGQIRETDRLRLILRLSNRKSKQIEFKPVIKTGAMLEVVRHTVAARLFSNKMMRDHARFAKRLSATIPVVELAYPRDLEKLSELRKDIQRYIQSRD